MSTITQSTRQLKLKTPLGVDALLLETFRATERLSQLFQLELDVVAEAGTDVRFEKLLAEPISISIENPDDSFRYFHGIVSRISQGSQLTGSYSGTTLVRYRLQAVPKHWLLTRHAGSEIFQQITVPDILKQIFKGFDVKFELQGTYEPRDYCTQYRESDFIFASRLMEEEGIYYFFAHSDDKHVMIVADTPQCHPATAPETIKYDPMTGGNRPENRIHSWEKTQEIRSGKYTLWDHCFELPDKNLESAVIIQNNVQVGTNSHPLAVGPAKQLEIYDYPGRYAQRFDGIDSGGGDRAGDVQKIFQDNKRTATLRMQEEAVNTIAIQGASTCGQLSAGHKFTLEDHFSGNGDYVITVVHHYGTQAGSFGIGGGQDDYSNTFEAIPFGLPYRPQSLTPKARIPGTQTATVVGPAREEIFTDKYGRVKVQFHWDRVGKKDADSSCWVRVATLWAGTQWGMIHIPRIGQEVVIAFEEGDPDRPIIVGSVYNAANMPPYTLPDNRTQSGLKSRSTLNGDGEKFHELRFEDKMDEEEIYFHSQKDFNRVVENNDTLKVGFEKKDAGDRTIEIFNNEKITIGAGKSEAADGSQTTSIFKDRVSTIETGNDKHTIKMGNQTTKISLGSSKSEAMQKIELIVGQSSITIDQTGVTIKGINVKVEGMAQAQLTAPVAQINGSGMCKVGGGLTMIG